MPEFDERGRSTLILKGDERGLTLAPTDDAVLVLSLGRAPDEGFSADMLVVWRDMERAVRGSDVLRLFVGDAEEVLDDTIAGEHPSRDFSGDEGDGALDRIGTIAQQFIMERLPRLGLTIIKVWCALPGIFKTADEDDGTTMLIDVENFVGQYLEALTYAPELADTGNETLTPTTGE